MREYRLKWYRDNRSRAGEYQRKFRLKQSYGLTVEEYDALLEKQGGLCAICMGTETGGNRLTKRFAVDHDHATGQVRGLLCQNCNNGLGRFKDSPDLLEFAAEYLRKNKR